MEQLFCIQPCKDEQVSDEDFLESIGIGVDKDDGDMTWYPGDCVLEDVKQGNEITKEANEEFMPGHSTLSHFILLVFYFIISHG